MIRHCVACVLLMTVALAPSKPVLAGNLLKDIAGIVTDPWKLGLSTRTLSESAERTLIQLTALENVANAHVSERLEQMRSIMKDAFAGTEALIRSATARMLELEEKINQDALNFLYRAQCAAETATMSLLQRGFAELIENIRKADPGIEILGIQLVGIGANEVKITEPDKAYISMKNALYAKLDRELKEESAAFDILSHYQNLAKAAKYTRCHYIGSVHELQFTREINEMERLSYPWVSVVAVKMGQN